MKMNEFFGKTFTKNFIEEADAQYETIKQEVEITVTKNPTMSDIVKDWLKNQNLYDGLYNEIGECGCKKDDLEPCGDMTIDCVPGFLTTCTPDNCAVAVDGKCDYHIRAPRESDYNG